ncbi:hyaluronan synthase [Oxobacter pfennigii]|uniref:Hyaluronan synthase n=1 Tax=Oxobacter pfennigii TaxID=36849 RepID=A0A0P8YVF3_9CLOT|nr:glycosyltransferase [Oxobacter pfennigii]KPU43685.1 hyaluronan synthase [Oxobacter pfennigii]
MKIGYIDHSFHKKTLSSQFFVDILQRNGLTVEYIWDDSWKGGRPIVLDDLIDKYDAFVFHQLSATASKPYYQMPVNITYLPMLDSFGNDQLLHHNRWFWKDYSGVKFLCFSKALHYAALSHGLASKYVKYFPEPFKFAYGPTNGDLKGFFWQRMPDNINWETLKLLISNANFSSIHIHMATDPGFKPFYPSKKDIAKYNITFSDWFDNKDEYYKKILDAQVYFAPRPSEGIGMAFLEAMAMGRCVVSPDYGTMNEYILNGVNGLLYDLKNLKPLNFSDIDKISSMARLSIEKGYEDWKKEEEKIIDFIIQPRDKVYLKYYQNGANYDELALSSTVNSNTIHEKTNITEIDKSFRRLKRYIGNSKMGLIIMPIWDKYKKIKKRHVNAFTFNENERSASKLEFVSDTPIVVSLGSICGRYLQVSVDKNNNCIQGGLRLKGKYKTSYTNKPLVTIITVVFNRKNKIERAIKSVLNQTYDNIEYVIVDGGSTDGTLDVIKNYEDTIDYYVSEPDEGIYNAINKGLALSFGDYIGILNSDDWYTEDAVEFSIKEILNSSADYSGAEEYVINEDGSLIGIYELKHFDEVALFAQNPCNHGTMFISRCAYEVIGHYDESYRIAADFKMQLLLVTNKNLKGCMIKKPIHYYESAGLSSIERENTLKEVALILKEFHTTLTDEQIKSLVEFMHEFKLGDVIIKNLESIIQNDIYTVEQKKYLLDKMRHFGYVTSDILGHFIDDNNNIDIKSKLGNLTIKKILKYVLPYGIVEMYKKSRILR